MEVQHVIADISHMLDHGDPLTDCFGPEVRAKSVQVVGGDLRHFVAPAERQRAV